VESFDGLVVQYQPMIHKIIQLLHIYKDEDEFIKEKYCCKHFSMQHQPSEWLLSMWIICENHPFACYGAGWFSCFLVRCSKKYVLTSRTIPFRTSRKISRKVSSIIRLPPMKKKKIDDPATQQYSAETPFSHYLAF
jgi:hypothetical protein